MKLSLIKTSMVDDIWPYLRRHVAKIERDAPFWTVAKLYHAARSGAVQLWAVSDGDQPKAVFFVEFEQRGERTAARVLALAGEDIHEWKHLWPDLKAALKGFGADSIDMVARKGFASVFPDFRVVKYLYEVEL